MDEKEKQIEEITRILDSNCDGIPDIVCQENSCSSCKARQIIGIGYRKQSEGEWVGTHNLRHCSKCGNVVNFNNVSSWLYNFCPNCGAKMKGVNHEK